MHQDANWPRADAWLKATSPAPIATLGVLDVPINRSITPGSAHLAPYAIRKALSRYSTYDIEHEHDLSLVQVRDMSLAPVVNVSPDREDSGMSKVLQQAQTEADATVLLGGDNGVTRAAVHGLGFPLDRLGLITLDAHFDLRDTASGLHNGNPVRALLESGMPGSNVVQIGIQSFANSPAYAAVAKEAGILIVTAEQAWQMGPAAVLQDELDRLAGSVEAIYFDLDLDVMDRAFAPGTPGSRPGGFLPHHLRQCAFVAGSHPKVLAMDLVELDPTTDVNDQTALTAAACLLAFASGLIGRASRAS